jgi:urocanate hydratase
MVLDGSKRVDDILKRALIYDVMAGVARRSWARNENAIETVEKFNALGDSHHITEPFVINEKILNDILKKKGIKI